VSLRPFDQRAKESIRGNGIDAYPVERAFTHFFRRKGGKITERCEIVYIQILMPRITKIEKNVL